MSKYLVKVEETYRVDSEYEAATLIDNAKIDNRFELAKYSSVKRSKKSGGEVADEWLRVTLTKVFTDEKDPVAQMFVNYDKNGRSTETLEETDEE